MIDAQQAISTLRQAAALNRESELLCGSVLEFPNYGQVVMTGDLHGHRRNFTKLQRFCCLAHTPARHVIIHELIHEEAVTYDDVDSSYELLIDTARWKCEHPDQVHFLMGNHELAQLTGHEIAKNGRIVTYEYERAVHAAYPEQGREVLLAMAEFMRSFALAGRTATGIFLSHSLPGPRELPAFDPTVFSRTPTDEDLTDFGSAYLLVWGRYQTEKELIAFSGMVGAEWFICGHQPQEEGYGVLHDRMIILASDHNHGVFLPIDLSKTPKSIADLTRRIRPFAGVE